MKKFLMVSPSSLQDSFFYSGFRYINPFTINIFNTSLELVRTRIQASHSRSVLLKATSKIGIVTANLSYFLTRGVVTFIYDNTLKNYINEFVGRALVIALIHPATVQYFRYCIEPKPDASLAQAFLTIVSVSEHKSNLATLPINMTITVGQLLLHNVVIKIFQRNIPLRSLKGKKNISPVVARTMWLNLIQLSFLDNIAYLLSDAILYPLQTIFLRLIAQQATNVVVRYDNVFDAGRRIYYEEGIRGFYHGFSNIILLFAIEFAVASGWSILGYYTVPLITERQFFKNMVQI